MDDVFGRMLELSRKGYFCAQILMQLALDAEGKDCPELIRAMGGLNAGIGFSGGPCGALTGGACFLAYFSEGLDGPDAISHFYSFHNHCITPNPHTMTYNGFLILYFLCYIHQPVF